MTLRLGRWKTWAALLALLALGGWAALELTLRSDWFAEKLRAKVVEEIAGVTGAHVDVESVSFERATGRVRISGLALRVNPDEEPFLELAEAETAVSLHMLLGSREVLPAVILRGLAARLTLDEEGRWNWPSRIAEGFGASSGLRIERLDLEDGLIVVDGRPYRLQAAAEGLELSARRGAEGGGAEGDCYAVSARAQRFAADRSGLLEASGPLSADLRLCGSRISIVGLDYQARDSTLTATGEIELRPTQQAELAFQFDGPLERWISGLPREMEVRGRAAVSGSAQWNESEALAYSLDVSAASLSVDSPLAAVSGAELRLTAGGDRGAARIESLHISALGGSLAASGRVVAPFDAPRLEIEGELSDLRLQGILAAMAASRANPALPPSPWISTVSGGFSIAGSSASDLDAAADLALSAPPGVPGPALEGAVALSYSGADDTVALRALELAGPGTRISARGAMAADGASVLAVAVRADSPDRVETLLNLTGRSLSEYPFRLDGPVAFEGDVTGRLRLRAFEAAISGRLETGPVQLLRYDWDSLTANVRLDGKSLLLEQANLRDGEGRAVMNVAFESLPGEGMRQWPLSGDIEGGKLNVSKAVAAADLPLPVRGALSGAAKLGGTLAALEVDLDFRVQDGDLVGMRFDDVRGSALAAAGRIDIRSLEATRADAQLSGAGLYTRDPRTFVFKASGGGWNPGDWSLFDSWPRRPSADLSFQLELDSALTPKGTVDRLFESLDVQGSWNLAGLKLGERDAGTWQGAVATQQGVVRLDLSGVLLEGRVSGSGTIGADDLELDANLLFDGFALETLTAAAGLDLEQVSGSVSGSASVHGPLSNLDELQGEGEFRTFQAEFAEIPGASRGYSLYNPFPMHWSYRAGALRLEHMRLQGEGTDIELDGSIGIGSDARLDLTMEGEFNLTALSGLRPGLNAAGRSTVQVGIAGDPSKPDVTGELVFRNADLRSDDFPTGLTNLNGEVLFDGRDLRIERLQATSGGGRVTVAGGARLGVEGGEFRFEGRAEDVRVRYPTNISSTIDGDFILSGAPERSLLTGNILVKRMTTSRDTTLSSLIDTMQEPTPAAEQPGLLEDLQINVNVVSSPNMKIDTALIRDVAADIDLRVVGSFSDPSLLGDVTINRGEVSFHGSRYAINRGDIEFRNPVRIEPVLDFELETRIRAVDIALILSGPARKLNISYRSDPPLSFSDLVNLVAVGRAPTTDPLQASQQRVAQQSLFQTGANNVFSEAVRRPVSPGLQRFFGVSRLKVDPQVGGPEANPAARISTEQQITDDVTLIYTYDLSSSQQQTVRLEWAPNRRWTFVLTRDENGLVGSDILYRTRLP